jgi:hypothetical protein
VLSAIYQGGWVGSKQERPGNERTQRTSSTHASLDYGEEQTVGKESETGTKNVHKNNINSRRATCMKITYAHRLRPQRGQARQNDECDVVVRVQVRLANDKRFNK